MQTRRRLTAIAAIALALLTTAVPGVEAARPENPGNPLAAAVPWHHSTITTAANPELRNYLAETDPAKKSALAKIALTPRARWFANCRSCNVATVRQEVSRYVADSQRGDPNALVQLAIFGLWPKGEVVRGKRPKMSWSMAKYQRWISEIAAGIGDARVAIILEPDLAISANHSNNGRAMRDPSPRKRTAMAAWSARYLSRSLPRAAIYLDAGSADWLYVDEAVRLLLASGIQHVRGFALGATHYDSVADNVRYADRLRAALASRGVPGKYAVIDTADNGSPFTWQQWDARWGARFRATGNLRFQFDNTPTCRTPAEQVCQTLGHRPTWDPVGAEAGKLGLGEDNPSLRSTAASVVDGYLWFGRGWRWMQMGGTDAATRKRSVSMGMTTPFSQAQ